VLVMDGGVSIEVLFPVFGFLLVFLDQRNMRNYVFKYCLCCLDKSSYVMLCYFVCVVWSLVILCYFVCVVRSHVMLLIRINLDMA
jgi:hypothetical protein